MTLTLKHPRAKRRWLVSAAIVAALTLGVTAISFAVHQEEFQLDGDVLATVKPAGSTQAFDWDTLINANGTAKTSLPTNFRSAGFDKDFNNSGVTFLTNDTSTFATGSKDTLPISGWQCNFDNNVNSKIDVMNAYAASYLDPNGSGTTDDEEIIYFALERNTNTGDANVGFWFLQDDTVGCETSGASTTFTGQHTDGDLLIVSAFSGGGTVSTINVYRWNGGPSGSLGTTPVASGVDCRSSLTPADDDACGAANRVDIDTPWLTSNFKDKVGNKLRVAEFFEGGVNLTQAELGGRCFNTFMGDTRSSTSLTATLFDYSLGKLGDCKTTLTTEASLNANGTTINNGTTAANGTASSGTDSATVSVTGASTWSGELKTYICGPLAASAVCDANGVLVSTATVSNSSPTAVSGSATLTSAGRYCWFAAFLPDAATLAKGVAPATHDGSSTTPNTPNKECFTVAPATPSLTTLAGTSPVAFGQAVTDKATLGGVAKEPGSNGTNTTYPTIGATNGAIGGTIEFVLKGPDSATTTNCTTNATAFAGETQTFPISVTVTGNGDYNASFKPGAPGEYHWVATYKGPGTGGTAVNTANLPLTHNGTCTESDEDVVVQQIPTSIKSKQSWIPNDTAQISATSGNLAAGGTVVFSLYGTATCDGAVLYTETETLTGGNPTEEVGTSNTTAFNITTSYTDAAASVKAFAWKVVYTPAATDTAHTGIQSACNAEKFSITYTNDNGPGTALP